MRASPSTLDDAAATAERAAMVGPAALCTAAEEVPEATCAKQL